MKRRTCLPIAAALAMTVLAAVRADEYITVDPGELKANPQSFWARGIVFSDVLEAVGGAEPIKLEGKRYDPVQTRALGICYLDPALEGGAAALQTGREYAFSGSVYQKDAGFFSSKRQFFVIIKRATASASAAGKLAPDQLQTLALAAGDTYGKPLQELDEILSQALREIQAYCAASNVEMSAIFEPNSRHAPRLTQAVRQAIYTYENKNKTPATEYMVTLLTSLMVSQHGAMAPIPAPAPTPAPAPIPEPAPELAPAPAPVAVPEPEPPPEVIPEPEPVIEPVVEAMPEAANEPIIETAGEPVDEALPDSVAE